MLLTAGLVALAGGLLFPVWQVAAAALFDFSALLVATPLPAAIFVLVRKNSVEDTLHDYGDEEAEACDSTDRAAPAPAGPAAAG